MDQWIPQTRVTPTKHLGLHRPYPEPSVSRWTWGTAEGPQEYDFTKWQEQCKCVFELVRMFG